MPMHFSAYAIIRPMDEPEDVVPVFGTWGRIYTAVVACALAVMGLIAAFSAWRW